MSDSNSASALPDSINESQFEEKIKVLYYSCESYFKKYDYSYVFDLCCDVSDEDNKGNIGRMEWLVIMQKLPDTKRNADLRINAHNEFFSAEYRANKLNVIAIINMYNPKISKDSVTHLFCMNKTIYKVGNIISVSDYAPHEGYDYDIDCINPTGIRYFQSLYRACKNVLPEKYTGSWTFWHDNGLKFAEGNYVDGKQSGEWIEWNEIGRVYIKYYFKDDNKTTEFVQDNGLVGERYWLGIDKWYVSEWRDFDRPPCYF